MTYWTIWIIHNRCLHVRIDFWGNRNVITMGIDFLLDFR